MRERRDDAVTVAGRVIAIDDVRVPEGQPGELQKGENRQAMTIVAGHAEQSAMEVWGEPRVLLHDRRDVLHASPSQQAHSRRRDAGSNGPDRGHVQGRSSMSQE